MKDPRTNVSNSSEHEAQADKEGVKGSPIFPVVYATYIEVACQLAMNEGPTAYSCAMFRSYVAASTCSVLSPSVIASWV